MPNRRATRLLACTAILGCLLAPVALAGVTPWMKLTPIQREALAPLAKQWDALPENYQRDMLGLTKHYEKLTPEQKTRLRTRLLDWNRLTPQQRAQARQKFTAFSKAPPEKREMVKSMVRERQAASATTATQPTPAAPDNHR